MTRYPDGASLYREATLHNLTNTPSKAKIKALARLAMILVCLFLTLSQARGADIVIESGQESGTVMEVGPGVGNDHARKDIDIVSDPDNGTVMRVTPTPEPARTDSGTIIVSPRVHVRE
jgi:hypothetical protein